MNDVLNKDQWISYYIADTAYAHPIEVIREIVPYRPAAPVPGAPSEVEGIVNIRGDVISIVSTRALMDAPKYEADDLSRILIIEHEQDLLGFSVDKVGEIIGFNNEQIENSQTDNPLINGTVHLNQGLYIVTDLRQYVYKCENDE